MAEVEQILVEKNGRNSEENDEELERKREFHRVIEMIRAKAKRDESGTRNSEQQQQQQEPEMREEIQTMSSDSDQTLAVTSDQFQKIPGATSVSYSLMGQPVKYKIATKGTWRRQ